MAFIMLYAYIGAKFNSTMIFVALLSLFYSVLFILMIGFYEFQKMLDFAEREYQEG
jgi:hypothetical protein